MTIDLRLLIAFASPYGFVALINSVFWCAGAEPDPIIAAVVSLCLGMVTATVCVLDWATDIRGETSEWRVTIGKRQDDAE